jgi:hypothetical protein
MANCSCPCCGIKLKKWGAKSRLVPWWKILPGESAYKADLYQCNRCKAIVRETTWPWGLFFRVGAILAVCAVGVVSKLNGAELIPSPFWGPVGIGVGILPEIFERVFSNRPMYILNENMNEATYRS